jgi:hypothetical protein
MQLPHTSTLPRRRAQGRRPWLTAGTAVLLAIAAAGTWQTVAQRGSAPHTPSTTSSTTSTTSSTSSTGTGPSAGTATVYLVGSPEEAMRVQAALDERDAVLRQFGRGAMATQVLAVTAAADAARIAQAQADADAIRATLGLPPLPLIDLRSR